MALTVANIVSVVPVRVCIYYYQVTINRLEMMNIIVTKKINVQLISVTITMKNWSYTNITTIYSYFEGCLPPHYSA